MSWKTAGRHVQHKFNMRRIILSVFIVIIGGLHAEPILAQNNPVDAYSIKVQVKPYRNEKIYFGHYFGGYIRVVDSVVLNDRSEATFKGPVKLPEGIYAMCYPDRSYMCDVMIDTMQHFSIIAERPATGDLVLQFKNSPDNTLLDQYEHYMLVQGKARLEAKQKLQHANGKLDSSVWKYKLAAIDDSIQNFRENIIKKIPGSVLSRLFITMREVKLPAALAAPKTAADSAAARQFISDHYWDGVNFWDGSLTYSPSFEDKIDKYFMEVLPRNEDTIIKKIDWMMSYAVASDRMTEFLLRRLVFGSMNHSYIWGNEVFIHLFEKYVAPKTYTWLLEEERRVISERGYVLMGKTVGSPAPDINLPSLDGKNTSLYSVNANYTILSFWDPLCSHCRLILPRLDSLYSKEWKATGIKVFSIGNETDGTKDDWVKYITVEHNLQDWTNVYASLADNKKRYDAGLKDYVQLYEVLYYPSFFLLDKNKKFIAKRLKFEQMVDLLGLILKQNR